MSFLSLFDAASLKHYTFLRIIQWRCNMPLITVKIIEGRTLEQKRGIAKDVTEAIVKNIGCPASAVNIDIVEMKPQNFSVGGIPWCDNH